MSSSTRFPLATQRLALARQCFRCAACGTPIDQLGNAGRAQHQYGEAVHAHHILHAKLGGTNDVANCAIICEACHYCVHEGGNYRRGTAVGTPEDFSHYSG